jgi:Zn-dependent protease with chaperone function
LLISAQGTEAQGRWSPARLGALALAWSTHLATLALVAIAVLLVVWAPLVLVIDWFLAAVVALIAFAVFPRLPALPRDSQRLDRSSAPVLFSLLDDAARVVRTPVPDVVVIDDDFNAWAATVGWRRRRVMGIGRPLWLVLSPQQRVALLGHELGHFAADDCRNVLVVGAAIRSLAQWYRLLSPMSSDESAAFRFAATPYAARTSAATYRVETAAGVALFNLVMALPRQALVAYFHLLTVVSARASQRAEFRADRMAARLGSSAAAIEAIDRAYLAPVVDTWMLRVSRGKVSSAWSQLADEVDAVPARQVERMRRVGRLRRQRIDATHPSNAARIDALTALPLVDAAVTLSPSLDEAVLREIFSAAGSRD